MQNTELQVGPPFALFSGVEEKECPKNVTIMWTNGNKPIPKNGNNPTLRQSPDIDWETKC